MYHFLEKEDKEGIVRREDSSKFADKYLHDTNEFSAK